MSDVTKLCENCATEMYVGLECPECGHTGEPGCSCEQCEWDREYLAEDAELRMELEDEQ